MNQLYYNLFNDYYNFLEDRKTAPSGLDEIVKPVRSIRRSTQASKCLEFVVEVVLLFVRWVGHSGWY